MPVIKYKVILSQQERSRLLKLVSKGKESVRKILHANILLAADESNGKKLSEKEIAEQFHVNYQTVHTVRKTYATAGLDVALGRKKRMTPPVPAKITGDIEARIIALSCSEPPEGRARWTLRILANRAVELQYIDSISHEAVGQLLKKTNSNLI